jgi:hypothetical protein
VIQDLPVLTRLCPVRKDQQVHKVIPDHRVRPVPIRPCPDQRAHPDFRVRTELKAQPAPVSQPEEPLARF